MSREIRYRAWTFGREPHMVDVKCICWNDDGSIERIETDFRIYDKDDEYVLVQNTGLKDKNGNEIYEGDVLLLTWPASEFRLGSDVKEKDVVIFHNGCFDCQDIRSGICRQLGMESDNMHSGDVSMEIIGNIYENPELLERNHEQKN